MTQKEFKKYVAQLGVEVTRREALEKKKTEENYE